MGMKCRVNLRVISLTFLLETLKISSNLSNF
jgi:hypothetical protein